METLALIELFDRDGLARQAVRVTSWPVRIGRAIDCDVVLDDPHVAPHHADLVWHDDGVHVEPAATLNGVRLGRAAVAAGSTARLPPSGELCVGATALRVRLVGEVLAPEQRFVDMRETERRRAVALVGLVVLAATWRAFDLWLSSVPGESGSSTIVRYLAAPVGLIVWCALWALGSKLFQHRFAFWPHLRLALMWLLIAFIGLAVSGQIAFALSVPAVVKLGHVVFVGAIAALLWHHMSLVLPQHRRAFGLAVASAVTVGGGLLLADRALQQEPLVGDLYLGTISIPGVRIAKPVSAEAFVQSAQPLEKRLSKWSKASGDDADEPGSDDDE